MEKSYIYIYERKYKFDSSIKDSRKKESWKRLFGEEFLQDIYNKREEIRGYLDGQNWRGYCKFDLEKNIYDKKNIKRESREFIRKFLKKTDNFDGIYEEILMVAYQQFLDSLEDEERIYTVDFLNDFLTQLLEQLKLISIRVLISEIHSKFYIKDKNALFNEFIKEIFLNYPVLERCFWECVSKNIAFFSEILNRLSKDKTEIEKCILHGNKFEKLIGVKVENSDLHFSGKQVLQLTLDNGMKVIYKPHNIKNEKLFDEFLDVFGNACEMKMHFVNKIIRLDYGWTEYVEKHECKKLEEIKKYYYRIGIIIFVCYVLGTNDIHYENMIAHGEFPVIVDLENIISINGINKLEEYNSSIELILKESVLYSGILPYFWKDADLSAISGGDNCKMPFKSPVIKEYGTKKVHIEYEYKTIKNSNNRATLNGEFICPNRFEKEIIGGFEKAFRFALKNKKVIKSKLEKLDNIRVRYLIDNTQKYNMLLFSSYHPYVMINGADREFLLNFLWKGRKIESDKDLKIIDAEIFDLLNNDIPYFYFYMNRTDLFDSRNNKISNFFQIRPIKQLIWRFESMKNTDMILQKNFIHILLSFNEEEGFTRCSKFYKLRRMIERTHIYTDNEMLNMAECIADKLLSEAKYSEDKKSINWFHPYIVGNQFGNIRIQKCGVYIYNGISGIFIFLVLLNLYSLKKKYENVCKKLRMQLFLYTDKIRSDIKNVQSRNSGIYNGEGSIVYTYLVLFRLTKKQKYLEYAEKHIEIVIQLAHNDKNNDLMDGIAGAIVVLCFLYSLTNKISYLNEAKKIAKKLIHNAIVIDNGIAWKQVEGDALLLGMAHGNSGIIIAFSKLYKLTKDETYYLNIVRGLNYERSNYDCTTSDWIDFRVSNNGRKISPAAWCHGAGGILLSRLLLTDIELKAEDKIEIDKDIERDISYLEKNKLRQELCLCHGECGNLLINLLCKKKGYIFNVKSEEEIWPENIILTKEWYNPGLMDGYTGIGYYFLMQFSNISNYIFLEDD